MPLTSAEIAALIERQLVPLQIWLGGRSGDAEEIAQEAFCRLAREHPPPGRPVAWLYRVARNLAESRRTADARRRRREQRAAQLRPERVEERDQEDIAAVVRALETLPIELRQVVVARLWSQMTFEEISQLLGVSLATASRRYKEALGALKQKLESPCPDRTT